MCQCTVHHKVASNRKPKAVMGRGKGHIKGKGREDDKIIANILKSARTKECKKVSPKWFFVEYSGSNRIIP